MFRDDECSEMMNVRVQVKNDNVQLLQALQVFEARTNNLLFLMPEEYQQGLNV